MAETNSKKLNGSGLATLWGLIKNHVSGAISALSSVYSPLGHKHTKSDVTDLVDATDTTGGLMTTNQARKLAGIESGAEVNLVNGIQKNGVDIVPDGTTRKVNIVVPTKTSDITNDSDFPSDASYVHTDNNYTTTEKTKLGGIDTGAQVNVIETVKVKGTSLTPVSKAVDITVPTDNASLTNGAGYQTASDVNRLIDAKTSSMYKPQGSSTLANLPDPSASNEGYVWNMSEAFTTNNKFVEGAGKAYPVGTNVIVIKVNDTYMFDVLSGFIDTSKFATTDDVETLTQAEIEGICV